MVNARAIETLPEPLRAWYAGNAAWVAEHAIDADLERDRSDDPDHFLDFDAFGAYPFPDVGEDEAEHLRRFGAEARAKGRVPWRIAEDYRDLVAAFRAGDLARVLRRSASVGAPDRGRPRPPARHPEPRRPAHRAEGAALALGERAHRPLPAPDRAGGAAGRGGRRSRNPVAMTLAVLRESYLHSLEVLASDRAVAGPRDFADTPEDDRYDDAYYSRLFEREATRVRSRLGASASAAASLWLAAWEEAGRPALDARFRLPYVRGQARAVLLSLDGAGAEVIDDAVARGLMPRLAALRTRGRFRPRLDQRAAHQDRARARRPVHRGLGRSQRHRRQRGAGAGRIGPRGPDRVRLDAAHRGADLVRRGAPGPRRGRGLGHAGLSIHHLHRRPPVPRLHRPAAHPVRRLPEPRRRGRRDHRGHAAPGSRPARR